MTKFSSLARARVIGPEGGAWSGGASGGAREGAAGVDVLVVSSSSFVRQPNGPECTKIGCLILADLGSLLRERDSTRKRSQIARIFFLFVLRLWTGNDLRDQADLASTRSVTTGSWFSDCIGALGSLVVVGS